ncbi:unnamed protein product [Ostreobium quekettii]|uniref:Uncharacterized protein n=1 Tax=Ostreobium quekettii TaxID=121088 RepID=A0A8S1J7B2_9CHLO|nr:unnamed protein product [Ostreobium quekettii]
MSVPDLCMAQDMGGEADAPMTVFGGTLKGDGCSLSLWRSLERASGRDRPLPLEISVNAWLSEAPRGSATSLSGQSRSAASADGRATTPSSKRGRSLSRSLASTSFSGKVSVLSSVPTVVALNNCFVMDFDLPWTPGSRASANGSASNPFFRSGSPLGALPSAELDLDAYRAIDFNSVSVSNGGHSCSNDAPKVLNDDPASRSKAGACGQDAQKTAAKLPAPIATKPEMKQSNDSAKSRGVSPGAVCPSIDVPRPRNSPVKALLSLVTMCCRPAGGPPRRQKREAHVPMIYSPRVPKGGCVVGKPPAGPTYDMIGCGLATATASPVSPWGREKEGSRVGQWAFCSPDDVGGAIVAGAGPGPHLAHSHVGEPDDFEVGMAKEKAGMRSQGLDGGGQEAVKCVRAAGHVWAPVAGEWEGRDSPRYKRREGKSRDAQGGLNQRGTRRADVASAICDLGAENVTEPPGLPAGRTVAPPASWSWVSQGGGEKAGLGMDTEEKLFILSGELEDWLEGDGDGMEGVDE